jgi:hypothetical protein
MISNLLSKWNAIIYRKKLIELDEKLNKDTVNYVNNNGVLLNIIENSFDIEYLSISNIKTNLENNLFIENKIINNQDGIFDKLNKK